VLQLKSFVSSLNSPSGEHLFSTESKTSESVDGAQSPTAVYYRD